MSIALGWLENNPPPPCLAEDGYWTGILGFSRYMISAEGRIISFWKRRPRLIKPVRSGAYLSATLVADDGSHWHDYIHRFVLEAYEGPRGRGLEARHLNGNPHDNRPSNLAWGTRVENAADRTAHGTAATGERNPMARLTAPQCIEMRTLYAMGGWSYRKLGAKFSVSVMTAMRAIRRQSWKHL